MNQPGGGDAAGGFDVLTFNRRYSQAGAIAGRVYSGSATMVVRRIMPRSRASVLESVQNGRAVPHVRRLTRFWRRTVVTSRGGCDAASGGRAIQKTLSRRRDGDDDYAAVTLCCIDCNARLRVCERHRRRPPFWPPLTSPSTLVGAPRPLEAGCVCDGGRRWPRAWRMRRLPRYRASDVLPQREGDGARRAGGRRDENPVRYCWKLRLRVVSGSKQAVM